MVKKSKRERSKDQGDLSEFMASLQAGRDEFNLHTGRGVPAKMICHDGYTYSTKLDDGRKVIIRLEIEENL